MHHPLVESLLALDRLTATRILVDYAREHGPLATVDRLVSPALDTIGHAWDRGDASLAQVFVAARICEEVVTPILPDEGHRIVDQPRIAIAVLDDAHALGKRIVNSVLHASGFVVKDYGTTILPDALAAQATNDGIDVLKRLPVESDGPPLVFQPTVGAVGIANEDAAAVFTGFVA